MNTTLEKCIYYVLGGMSGTAIGSLLLSFDLPFLSGKEGSSVLIISALLGIIISLAIHELEEEKVFKNNQKIRDETVALITHEMRTALTSTSWALQLISETYGGKISAEHDKMLKDTVKSINTTVMHSVNLLDISLLDIGKLVISLQWESLETVEGMMRDTIEKYRFGAERAGIHVNESVKLDHTRQVEVDMMRLRIVLENLLENSIQYASGENKEITIDVSNDQNSLKLMVKDNGIGIPKGEHSKIFSEFYRASNARKKLGSGSGIGLHMCEQYVKAHHGTIRFESEEGNGTTFYVKIPLKTVADVNEFLNKI